MISYVFACNKNKALQLQHVPVLSILGYNNDLYFKQAVQFPKPKTAANLTTAPSGQRSCYATANRHCRDIYSRSPDVLGTFNCRQAEPAVVIRKRKSLNIVSSIRCHC